MTQIGADYSQALYGLAKDEGVSQTVLEQLQTLQEVFGQERDFLRLLGIPSLSKQERCQILDNSFRGKLHPYVLNFLKLLTEKGYLRCFEDCCKAYRVQYNTDNGILPVCAVTAVPLDAQQSKRLTQKLETVTGKRVELVNQVDPGCLGGVRLDYDGKCLDGTVQNRLESIAVLLKNTVF